MPTKMLDLTEFREAGYLQELNRRFLHPLGLAMAVDVDDDGRTVNGIVGIYDSREDPQGFAYAADQIDPEKAAMIDRVLEHRLPQREALLGWIIQPVDAFPPNLQDPIQEDTTP